MIFYKITQSKNSLSKEGETLYFAKTIITGETDRNYPAISYELLHRSIRFRIITIIIQKKELFLLFFCNWHSFIIVQ